MKFDRNRTTMQEELERALKSNHSWNPMLPIESMAETLEDINAAIRSETGESDPWFEDENALISSYRESFISFHSDGFIIWADEPGWQHRTM